MSIYIYELNSNDDPILKWTKYLNRHFSKKDIQIDKKAYENMFNISDFYRNVNQNDNKIPLHTNRMTIIKRMRASLVAKW